MQEFDSVTARHPSVYLAAVTDFAECIVIKNISSDGQEGTILAHDVE